MLQRDQLRRFMHRIPRPVSQNRFCRLHDVLIRDSRFSAASLGVHQLFLLGTHAAAVAAGARAGGLAADAIHIGTSHAEVAAAVMAQWQSGDCVLVKGSHGMRMDEVVRLLEGAGMSP